MSQNEEKEKKKSKNNPKEKENLDIMLDNNTESYLIMKCPKIKGIESGKKKYAINYEEINNNDEDFPKPQKRKRTNSVDLYKKHKRDKEKKIKALKGSSKRLNNNIYDNVSENINLSVNKKPIKNGKNAKEKKVHFPKNFVTIIDIESYKKFNEENTCKDPFEDMEFLNNMDNLEIKNKKEKNEDNGKEQVNCTCIIY